MPQLQMIDFGPSPSSQAMGDFAKNFSGAFYQAKQEKNDAEIFKKIQQDYSDKNPEKMLLDILNAEGMSQEYKKNAISTVKDIISLRNKSDLTPYQKRKLDMDEENLDIKKEDIEKKKKKDLRDIGIEASKYSASILKDEDIQLSATDKSRLNSMMLDALNSNEDLSVPQAFDDAYGRIQEKNTLIKEANLTKKPSGLIGTPTDKQIEKAKAKVIEELRSLENTELTKADVKKMLARSGWNNRDVTDILNKLTEKTAPQEMTKEEQKEAGRKILFG